jgi:hypothetical protein
MTQKRNAVYSEPHTYTSWYKNSQNFVHTSRTLDMCSASHTADVEMIIQLVPNFVQSVPSDGSYGSCDLLPQLWQRSRQRQQTLRLLCIPTRSGTELSLAITACWFLWAALEASRELQLPQTTEILGWVVPCEIVCEMHVAQLLQTLSPLTTEHTNSSVVGAPF